MELNRYDHNMLQNKFFKKQIVINCFLKFSIYYIMTKALNRNKN